jgi:hypothetical protein
MGGAGIVWVSAGPSVALWVYVAGGLALITTPLLGFHTVLRKASRHQGRDVKFIDLVRMGAIVGPPASMDEPDSG